MKRVAAVLDFGTSKVVCAVGEKEGNGRLSIDGFGECAYTGFMDGEWLEPQKLEDTIYNAVREAEIKTRRRIKSLSVGVPGEFIKTVSHKAKIDVARADHRITEYDIKKLMDEAGSFYKTDRYQVVQRTPAYFILDNRSRVLTPIGMRSQHLAGMITYVLADTLFLRDIEQILTKFSVQVEAFIPVPHAVGMMVISEQSRNNTAVLIDTGYLSTTISVFEGDGLVFNETISMGGADITATLAEEMDISFQDAEGFKRWYAFNAPTSEKQVAAVAAGGLHKVQNIDINRLSRVIEHVVYRLSMRIKYTLDECGYRLDTRSIIHVTGGGLGLMRGYKQYLGVLLQKQIKISAPNTPVLNSPVYTSAVALIHEAHIAEQEKPNTPGLLSTLKALWK